MCIRDRVPVEVLGAAVVTELVQVVPDAPTRQGTLPDLLLGQHEGAAADLHGLGVVVDVPVGEVGVGVPVGVVGSELGRRTTSRGLNRSAEARSSAGPPYTAA